MKTCSLSASLASLLLLLSLPGHTLAGAACVIVKEQGDSKAIEWTHSPESAEAALDQAKQRLRQQGHKYLFPQATTTLKHAYVVIIESHYKNARGRDRTSYGCGFSSKSYDDALWAAIRNLQSYAWGWKPDREGYKIIEKRKY